MSMLDVYDGRSLSSRLKQQMLLQEFDSGPKGNLLVFCVWSFIPGNNSSPSTLQKLVKLLQYSNYAARGRVAKTPTSAVLQS